MWLITKLHGTFTGELNGKSVRSRWRVKSSLVHIFHFLLKVDEHVENFGLNFLAVLLDSSVKFFRKVATVPQVFRNLPCFSLRHFMVYISSSTITFDQRVCKNFLH